MERQRERETETETQRKTETERDRDRERQRQRDRQTETETERQRQGRTPFIKSLNGASLLTVRFLSSSFFFVCVLLLFSIAFVWHHDSEGVNKIVSYLVSDVLIPHTVCVLTGQRKAEQHCKRWTYATQTFRSHCRVTDQTCHHPYRFNQLATKSREKWNG